MYCIKCGVKLADTEKKCPLCNTTVCHPDFENTGKQPLYPSNKMPKTDSGAKGLNGAVIILFLIPLVVCLFADLSLDGKLEWFGYVAGALVAAYIAFALPLWFRKPNPVIFVPCNFVSTGLYLLYINFATDGDWFLSFAFPVVGGLCLITCAVVTLMYYLRRGRLYIIGGGFVALGAFMLLIEYLMEITFAMEAIGWSIYPMVVLVLFGGLLIYLAINKAAREILERKLFF
ncbi:MAG: hypothetical protein IJZ15_05365 [Oscillospiraceae bacterium]|nr:hypothetical protein [Oscillospiraceae bacterium]